MDEARDPFAELTRRGHLLFAAAVQAWQEATRSMVDAAGRPDRGAPDLRPSLDAAFDFAAQMLADQQEFARTLMSLGVPGLPKAGERPLPGAGPAATGESDADPDGRRTTDPASTRPAATNGADTPAAPEAAEATEPEPEPEPEPKPAKAKTQRKAPARKRTPTTSTAGSTPRKRTPRKAAAAATPTSTGSAAEETRAPTDETRG